MDVVRKSIRFDKDFGVVIMIFLLSFLVILIGRQIMDDAYNPLRYPVPQTILNTGRAEGVPGTALLQRGEVLETNGVKCNDSSIPLAVEGSVSLVRVSPVRTIVFVADFASIRTPGCFSYIFHNKLPDDLAAGTWRLEGVEKTVYNNRQVEAVWYSDYFIVAQ